MQHEERKNYYDILEISVNATQEEIYTGYMRIKNTYSQGVVRIDIKLLTVLTKNKS